MAEKRFIISDNETVSKEMVEELVEIGAKPPQIIQIKRLAGKVSVTLGSSACLRDLDTIKESPLSNLNLEQSGIYVDTLWQIYYYKIVAMTSISYIQFLVLTINVVFEPFSMALMQLNGAISTFIILLECFQMYNSDSYAEYFFDAFNIMDLVGNGCIITTTYNGMVYGHDLYAT